MDSKSLVGRKFNELEVIEYAGNYKWKCRCSCGEIRIVSRSNLISGNSTSCGHKSNKDKLVDLAGRKFGELEVLEYKKEDSKWLCKCSCGNTVLKRSWDLRNGKGTTCGVREKHKSKRLIDISEQQFGELKALRYVGDYLWECKCSCNRTILVDGNRLRNGTKTSCGHSLNQNKREDLTGRRFGSLKVIKYNTYKEYECLCDCGNTRIVKAAELKNGRVDRCKECTLVKLQNYYYDSRIDLLGERFGSLQVVDYIQSEHKWVCKCECGNEIRVYGQHLRVGDTKSCGCKYGLQSKYRSYLEKDVYMFIRESYNGDIIVNHRGILSGNREIDIYIPELKVGIEINGDYWHNEESKDKYYHQQKVIDAYKNGVRLVHIYEYEWLYNGDIIRKYLKSILSTKNKISARETYIKEVSCSEIKEFLNDNHLQGYCISAINVAMYKNEDLIAVMTFGKPRFNTNYDYELIRLCYRNNVTVTGGTAKMLKYFVEKYSNSIISYCNIDKFSGNTYTNNGFKLKNITEPGYVWINHKRNSILTRYQTQKHKLLEQGLGTEDQTEDEIMKSLNYMKIYNSGNYIFEYKNN